MPESSPGMTRRAWHEVKKICGMIALAIISGANPIPYGAACERGLGHAACRHVRACRLIIHDPEVVSLQDKRHALPGDHAQL
jgi:GTPase involved in cell partitioning and DNA repair